MKKRISQIIAILIITVLLSSCSEETVIKDPIFLQFKRVIDESNINPEEEILEAAQKYCNFNLPNLKDNPFITGTAKLTVKSEANLLHVSIDDQKFDVMAKNNLPPHNKFRNICKINCEEELKAFYLPKLNNWVNNAPWFEDKQAIIDYLSTISLKIADTDKVMGQSASALFDEPSNTIYICTSFYKNSQMYTETAESLILHEYTHAICSFTNGGDSKKPYCTGMFDELQTDIISNTIHPYISKQFGTVYRRYYDFIWVYYNCFHDDAIKAYFYGDYSFINKNELDLYASTLELFWDLPKTVEDFDSMASDYEILILSYLTLKWTAENQSSFS